MEYLNCIIAQLNDKLDDSATVDNIIAFVTEDSNLTQEFQDVFKRWRDRGESYAFIAKYFEELLRQYIGYNSLVREERYADVARQVLPMIANAAKQLVDLYRGSSDEEAIEGIDRVPEKRKRPFVDKEIKTGLVDTTEPYQRELIKN